MKKLIFCFFLCLSFITGIAQVNIFWQIRYSSTGINTDKAEDMVIDASGNVYVTGIARGDAGNFDYVTIKYNASGVQQWKSEYNGTGNSFDEAHAIAVDASGNVYVTGWSYGTATSGYDYATVKYNSAGVQQWASRYNNSTNGTDEAWDVAVDNAGNVFVTGTSDGSGSNSAATTIKYNTAGTQQWAKRYDGAGGGIDVAYAIVLDASFVYITGYSYVSTGNDFNYVTVKYDPAGTGSQVWASGYNGTDSKYDEARDITVDGSGNVYVTGYSQTAVLTNYDYATVKYNSSGVQQWVKRYNGTGNDYDKANAIKLDAANNVIVTGRSIGISPAAEDIVTIKYTNAGTQQWLNRYNGLSNGFDEGKALATDADGNIYVAGISFTAGSSNDFATIKYDSTGAQQWLTLYNGTGNSSDQAAAIAVDNNGNVFISGFSKGSGTNEDYETIKYCQLTANAGNDTSICLGANTTLTASAPGAVSYAWSPNDGTLSSLTSAVTVASPSTSTSYIVAITNANGCVDFDTVVVNVALLAAPTITANGSTSLCIGDSVTLTSSVANSYQWSSSQNDTMQSISVSVAGTYSVTIGNAQGCTATASQVVAVHPLPTIYAGPNDSTCISNNIVLNATGAATYSWHPGSTLSDSTVASPIAAPMGNTTYTVVGTSSFGCVNTDDVFISVFSNPPVPAITRGHDTLYCVPTATNYQWYLNGSAIAGATSQTYIFTQNGSYYVQVFNAAGCSTASTTINIVDAGIIEVNESTVLHYYPNPTSDYFILELNVAKINDIKINLVNVAGQLLFTDELIQFAGNCKKQISLNEFAKGVYYLQIITNDEVINKKVIKD